MSLIHPSRLRSHSPTAKGTKGRLAETSSSVRAVARDAGADSATLLLDRRRATRSNLPVSFGGVGYRIMIVPELASVYNDVVGRVGVLIEVAGYSKRGIEHHVGEF
jgi:hypothetical protein